MKLEDLRPHPAEIELVHPAAGKLNVYIEIVGKFSKEFNEATKEVLRDKNIFEHDFEIADEENTRTIAACVKGWKPEYYEFFGGPYDPDKFYEILCHVDFIWLKRLIEKEILASANFFRIPKDTSDKVDETDGSAGHAGSVGADSESAT